MVAPDGTLTVQLPVDIAPGEHRVVLVIEEQPVSASTRERLEFAEHDVGPWPADLPLRREDMYGDQGR